MCNACKRLELHWHTDYSNIRLLDCINSVKASIQKAAELGLSGMAITDHETLSAHMKAIQLVNKLKKEEKICNDFKLILGNEIYLVDSLEEVRDNYVGGVTKFPHFLLLAKNKDGHEALRILSSQAWKNSFYTGTMERVPTEKHFMKEILSQEKYKNTVIASSACFPKGTKINVNGKLKNIEKIEKNENVLTHLQNKKAINFLTERYYSGDMHTITVKGSAFPIEATADHKFLAIPAFKQTNSKVENMIYDENLLKKMKEIYGTKSRGLYKLKRYIQKIEPQWIEAKDLIPNLQDTLKPINEDIVDIHEIDISKHHKENSKFRIPFTVKCDEDLLWLLGIYTAEGSMDKVKKGRLNFKIDSEKTHLIDKIVSIVESKFNLKAGVYKRKESQAVDINISSIELHSLFEEWFDYGAENKAVPQFIKKLPFQKQKEYIKGFFLGDGHYRIRNEKSYNISCSTISKQLAYDLADIFGRIGVNILINQNPSKIDKNGVHHQQWYSLEMNSSIARKFIDFIHFDKELRIEPVDYTEKDIPFFWNGKKYFRNRIVKNTSQPYSGIVHCLNVSDDHSFEAEGTLVHNCLGSESSIHILGMYENWNEQYMSSEQLEKYKYHEDKLHEFIQWNIDLFGKDDFYLELQPAPDGEQRIVNEKLVELSKEYELKLIITNDVHYLRPEDKDIHGAYLRSKEADRETDSFYSHTFLHNNEEIFSKLSYLDEDLIHEAFTNSLEIGRKVEDYTLEAPTEIPISKLPEFEVMHTFQQGYEMYPYIGKMAYADNEQDRFLLYNIELGFAEKMYPKMLSKERFHEILSRINDELGQLWEISEKLNDGLTVGQKRQHMSSYYVTTMMIVNLIWGDDCGDDSRKVGSLVGSGRGSAVAFLINFLIGITQVDPTAYGIEIPYWRHLNHEMGDISSLDIDLDVTSTKKKYIFDRMKKFFGEDQVIQVCTFGKEKPKSALNTACRGLGIDSDTAQYIGSFVPFERGEHWSLSDCFYGNEEEGRKPITEFINLVGEYPKLRETALKIEGLINKRSTHAGGVLVLNDSYVKSNNALMRSPNGDFVTQFNLDDSQAAGGIKYDILTIEANDKIQTSMDLMLDDGVIEWQGTLRKTFEKYFHPEVIDKTSPELFETLGSGRVPDLFQFSTQLGQSVIKKVKPSTLIEATAISSIVRLMTEGGGEQPVDTFLRFKEDISQWYKEMEEYGLNEEEVKVFEKHLLHLNGVADSQESIMLMAMDKNIANFDLFLATKLRKLISKKKKEEALLFRKTIYEKTLEAGNRQEVADYLWLQVSRMLLYSFSVPHSLAYTLVGFEELNIFHHYNPLYWQTACLSVNSGSQEVDEDTKSKDTNYGKVAEAIGKMKGFGVNIDLPDINKAQFSFIPDIENDKIIYSLKGIVGLNDEIAQLIIANRPYSSFEDFYEKMYSGNAVIGTDEDGHPIYGKLLQKKHMLTLIKAGSFNSFEDPIEVMKKFIVREVDVKEKLNMQNIKSVIRLGLLDTPELSIYKEIVGFKEYVGKLKPARTVDKPKDTIVILDQYSYEFYQKNFPEQKALLGWTTGAEISTKAFKKEYDNKMQYIKDLMLDKEFIRQFNIAQFYELWDTMATGTVPKWEMDSVSYYSNEHELDGVNMEMYGISDYNRIDPEPVITGYNKYMGRDVPKFKTFTLIGTILDRNKDKHTFTLLTPDGVVSCKTYAGVFSHYDKTISKVVNGKKQTLEKSWFSRGNLVMVTGFRREDIFVLRTYAEKGQKKPHTVNLIKGIESDGSLLLQNERIKV